MSTSTKVNAPDNKLNGGALSEHEKSAWNPKSVQEVSKRNAGLDTAKRHPKTDLRYWQDAVFLPTYTKGGETRIAGEYAVKIQHAGRRETFSLGTSNKTAAAAKAKDIYISLQSNGWEVALAKFKPKASQCASTVGEFIEAVKKTATART